MTPEQRKHVLRQWVADRQRARTDLLFLCNEVLQYPDVNAEVHGPIIALLHPFQGGEDVVDPSSGALISYTPKVEMWDQPGPRNRLILDPRGHLKTTLITIAHAIQWIINYPDVRILDSMATGDQVKKVATETMAHFRYNEKFRFLFPEFCPPPKSVEQFGNLEGFTVPCRKRRWMKEATLSTCSVGKVVAGGHYDVIKHSDLVDKENVKTPGQVQDVIDHFKYTDPLLERRDEKPGWVDVEGTRYDSSDLYGWILDRESSRSVKTLQVSVRKAILDDGTPLFKKRFGLADLKRIEEDDPYIYSCQYLQDPIVKNSGLASEGAIIFRPRKMVQAYLTRLHMTVDLGGMDPQSSGDFTVITVGGFDRDGRMGIVDMYCGRPDPFTVIELLFAMSKQWNVADIKMEAQAYERMLAAMIRREQQKRGVFLPPLVMLKRDTRTTKKNRIKSLQPYFRGGLITFADELGAKGELIRQITRFSDVSTYHDDILDTLADMLQNRDGGVESDVLPQEKEWDGKPSGPPVDRFLGFDPDTHEQQWLYGSALDTASGNSRTGL